MKTRLIIALLFATIASRCVCASPAATEAWVSNYVANAISANTCSVSNSINASYYSSGGMTFIVENPSVYCLMATNATNLAVARGVTNNMYFAWNSSIHSYTNHAMNITATSSNLVWQSIQSVGQSFSNYFDVVGMILQPSYAKEVLK